MRGGRVEVLGLRVGEWDFALRRLAEYLTARPHEEDGVNETFYRIYHESFADFLRAKVATDQQRYRSRLADYCRRWQELPEGFGRTYALRFGPRHLLEVGRANEAVAQLLDWRFLEIIESSLFLGLVPVGAIQNLSKLQALAAQTGPVGKSKKGEHQGVGEIAQPWQPGAGGSVLEKAVQGLLAASPLVTAVIQPLAAPETWLQ